MMIMNDDDDIIIMMIVMFILSDDDDIDNVDVIGYKRSNWFIDNMVKVSSS